MDIVVRSPSVFAYEISLAIAIGRETNDDIQQMSVLKPAVAAGSLRTDLRVQTKL